MLAFVVAIILVYMVLASQFNSFIQPMIIMVAQPLAIIGGMLSSTLLSLVVVPAVYSLVEGALESRA